MNLSCLEAATDPLSRLCIRRDQEVNGRLSCAKAKEVAVLILPTTAQLSLFPYSVFSVQRMEIHSAEK